jgi:RimJ/RimL family protein N-acetyltransferase
VSLLEFNFEDSEFTQAIGRSWATFFSISMEEMVDSHALVLKEQSLKKEKAINVWYFATKLIIQSPNLFLDTLNRTTWDIHDCDPNTSLQPKLQALFPNMMVDEQDTIFIFHLKPVDFKLYSPHIELSIRELSKESRSKIARLKRACSKFEVQNSWIQANHPVSYGAYIENELVAIGSYINWGSAKEIGILTHPQYRHKGIGKAIVSRLCERALFNKELLVYRCHEGNIGSIKIAQSLGFRQYFNQTSFKIVKK